MLTMSRRTRVILPLVLVILALLLPPAVEAEGLVDCPGSTVASWGCWCSRVHVVRWGENLSRIARRYGVPMWAIAAANRLYNPNYIWAGQRLCIPSCGGYFPMPYCRSVHRVRRGENLYRISLRYGTSVWAIARVNGIRNPNRIYAGQYLCIP